MRIGIDVRKYSDFGIGRYIQSLLSVYDTHAEHEWVLFTSPDEERAVRSSHRGKVVVNGSSKYSLGELITVSRQANEQRCDVFHAPHYTLPFGLKGKRVVTIHDLIHIRFTEYFSPPKRQVARALLRHACKASDAVIVDAEFTKQDILRDFDISPEKIHPIYLGVSPAFRPADEAPGTRDKLAILGLRRPYLLYSGALKRHKNLPLLFRAFARIVADHDLDLVLTGENIRDTPDLARLAGELGIETRILDLGRAAKDELVFLYQHARALVMPSLYEGFGLPLVEAMACGTPVVGANATTIPEILGGAGLLFDPKDPGDLARVLVSVLADEVLRAELRQKGLARAGMFSWHKCADETLRVYRAAAGK